MFKGSPSAQYKGCWILNKLKKFQEGIRKKKKNYLTVYVHVSIHIHICEIVYVVGKLICWFISTSFQPVWGYSIPRGSERAYILCFYLDCLHSFVNLCKRLHGFKYSCQTTITLKQIYLTHWWEPSRYDLRSQRIRVDLGVMAMNGCSTLPRVLELKPHHRIYLDVTPRTPFSWKEK